VANVLGEHCTRVPLAHDQYAVGELGSQGADEAFAKTVHLRATKRNSDHLDAHLGQDGINDAANWPTRSGALLH
jgi:hypothetical protein